MSSFWSWWIIVIVVINIGGSLLLLLANRKVEVRGGKSDEIPTTGHIYDGIEEYDNPLPRWWFNMFLITVIFSVVYLALYPGLGNFRGFLGWTSTGQLDQELAAAEEKYGPIFNQYMDDTIEELAANPDALKMGARLFANNCAVCHGSDGRGNYGFPNLADDDWLYGGQPENIKTSIVQGRNGIMNPWGDVIGEEGVVASANYVLKLSGRDHDAGQAAEGEKVYATYCSACHGADGKGNQTLGAPNLTDNTWLYGGSPEIIKHTIRNGRQGKMPAHGDLLKENRIHLLTAYVYSLSRND
ncbi:MAG: cytochrome-c oxidase, cbb3-type subunit III [Porticoccaceae bacterium]|nr:cytochrome-c oxidase, cbb3-type subunit III [Porticoccaceae bacterium]